MLRNLAAGMRALLRKRQDDTELNEELRSYLEASADDKMHAGMAPDEALRMAKAELGSAEAIKDDARDVGWESTLEGLARDLRYGLRSLRRNPAFTFVALSSLALGIGANTAIFQLINAVRLRALPVRAPHELVEVRLDDTKAMRGGIVRKPSLTYPLWEQVRVRQQVFSGVFAWGADNVNLAPGGEVRTGRVLYVSGDFFGTLGIQPAMGRLLGAPDDQPGCPAPALVMSYSFWQREYGGDPAVVGRKLTFAEHSFDIVGVTAADFFGMEVGRNFDLALPLCSVSLVRGNNNFLSGTIWWLTVMGRLKPDSSLENASAQVRAMSGGVFEAALPANYPPASIKDFLAAHLAAFPAATGISGLRQKYERPLWLLLAIAASVLLIACANLANLLLARATARQREISVRQALGAARARIIRQLLVESSLLAALGALLGAALAQVLVRLLVAFLNTGAERIFLDLTLDRRVLAFTAALTLLTCLLFGLVPALRATHNAPSLAMRSGRGMTTEREGFSLRRVLVIAQVALSLVLVASALLFSRSLANLLHVDTGFRQDGVVIARVGFQRMHLPLPRVQPMKDDLLDRIRAIPGVESAAISQIVPLDDWGGGTAWADGAEVRKSTNLSRVGPEYFKTLGIPFLAGRDFNQGDRLDTPPVAVVNQAFVRSFLHDGDAVGRHFWIEASPGSPDKRYQIVGVVRDTKYGDLRENFEPLVYYAVAQDAGAGAGFEVMVHSRISEGELVAAVKQVLNGVSPAITVSFRGFKPVVQATILRERLVADLSSFFGALALLLACSGIYGLLAYGVASRTHEIGIRLALGARGADVWWLILRETLSLLLAGIALGAPMVVVVGRIAATLLFGLGRVDSVSLLGAVVLMVGVALFAAYVPVRRAARVDPMVALRYE